MEPINEKIYPCTASAESDDRFPVFSAETAAIAPLPQALAQHDGPVRIAVIRNLGSDDNTTQFISGVLEEGKSWASRSAPF